MQEEPLVAQVRIHTQQQQQLVDITGTVEDLVRGWTARANLVYSPHTTAGILINEHADPDVATDILWALDEIVPRIGAYRHIEANSPAHVKTTLVGTSQLVPFARGRLALGRWQGIFLAEFDGPRIRSVHIQAL